jgi:oligopeptidase B
LSDEIQFIDADKPDSAFNDPETSGRNGIAFPHYGDHFYIMTNKDEAFNLKS